MVLINCGCGGKFHRNWINIDFNSCYENVVSCNLLDGLPFPDKFADFIYSSHFLEHLERAKADKFVSECYRVLIHGGGIRVVVPDLENVAREYLDILDQLKKHPCDAELAGKYDFIILELLDQMTRREQGGELGKYFREHGLPGYAAGRVGSHKIRPMRRKIENEPLFWNKIYNFMLHKSRHLRIYERGRFELSGEKHLWMYDKHSIGMLLEKCGFGRIEFKKYNDSNLDGFDKYGLETDINKNEYKPNSIYVEAQKI